MSEVKDPIHEVVHRSDARAGDQSIKVSGRYGGVSQDEAALDRLLITSQHLARMVKQYLDSFPKVSSASERNEH